MPQKKGWCYSLRRSTCIDVPIVQTHSCGTHVYWWNDKRPCICSTSFIRMWTHRWYIWAVPKTTESWWFHHSFCLLRPSTSRSCPSGCLTRSFPWLLKHLLGDPGSLALDQTDLDAGFPVVLHESVRDRGVVPSGDGGLRLGPIHHLLIRSRQATVWTTMFSYSPFSKKKSIYILELS